MKISPYYDAIKTRAIQLLTRRAGFNGYSQEEIKSWRKRDFGVRNCIGVALCTARNEIEYVPRTINRYTFNTGNFKKAQGEITRIMTGKTTGKPPCVLAKREFGLRVLRK